ncbi:DUF2628 domain-containing protein [Aquipseudomonas alcaligenes]|uniref:DUF2628 domain-containing protein n=1 Tax=Aquipseudomonas alcaligenes TaxID=43263 RepID=UPI001659F5CB|nr:DUF2628 domain-containing protein [Pseudomonas alcaligenes]
MQTQNPYATPKSSIIESNGEITEGKIESLLVSPVWKERFKAIYLAGGPKLTNIKNIPKSERRKAFKFNILAFLFGPIYYLSKGMWRKAILYTVAALIILVALGMLLEYLGYSKIANSLHFGASAFFAVRANIDFYKKAVLEENGWW